MLRRDVVEGVHRVEDSYVNWFIVEDGDALTIVDAGAEWPEIQPSVEEGVLDLIDENVESPAVERGAVA